MKYEDILSYRPNIERETLNKGKYGSTYFNVKYDDEYTSEYKNKSYSQAIEDISDYRPSDVYKDILDVIANIKDYLYSVEMEFGTKKINSIDNNKYIAKIKSKDINSYKDFEELIDEKYQNSTIEVYSELNSELEYLTEIKDTFADINYNNKDVNENEASEIDTATINKIKTDEGKQTSNINYMNISFDSKINMVLQGFVEAINSYTQNLFFLLYMDRGHKAPNKEIIKKGLEETFKDLSSYNLKDLSKLTKIKFNKNIPKILKHIQNTKVELNIMADAIEELNSDSQEYAMYVDNVYLKRIKEVDDMILDLFKECSLLASYKDDYLDTLIQKEYLRKVFLEF